MSWRILGFMSASFVFLLLALGCNRSGNDEIARARAETEAVKADADAARAEAKAARAAAARAEAKTARANADAARIEAKALQVAATSSTEQNTELLAANWVRQLVGLQVALIEGGYQFPIKPSDRLPDKPFRLHLIGFVGNPLQIDRGLANLEGVFLQGLWLHNS